MRHIDSNKLEWFGAVGHREGGIRFRRIFTNETLDANNYEFCLAVVDEAFNTPRHRHNFDQVRFMLEGEFGFGVDQVQKEHSIGYFPEGTYYQQKAEGPSVTLLLQCANASQSPYLDFGGLGEVVDRLNERGEFHDGVFTWFDDDGRKHNLDSHQAVYQEATGMNLVFPKPRYHGPIFLDPADFYYEPLTNQEGISIRRFLEVTERQLQLVFLRIESGASLERLPSEGEWLMYGLSGSGALNGQNWGAGHAANLTSNETLSLRADDECEIYAIRLPTRV